MHPDPPDPGSPLALSSDELAFLQELEQQLEGQDVERRQHERFELAVEVRLTSMDHAPIHGRTLDVSRGGIRAVFDHVPELGTHYAVCLLGLQAAPVRTLGRCLRAAMLEDDRCEAVLHFADPLPADGPLG